MSNTPLFDKTTSEYYKTENGQGLKRICKISATLFELREKDVEWYQNFSLPLPNICPIERLRRKTAYQNTQSLFRVQEAGSGEQIIAAHPNNTPNKIYRHEKWYGDSWDPLSFGINFNESRSFFEQFKNLQLAVPRPNLVSDSTNVRSDYTNTSTYLKDCYLTFDSTEGEFLYYFVCCKKKSPLHRLRQSMELLLLLRLLGCLRLL